MRLKLGCVKTLNYIKCQVSGSTVHVDRLTALILNCKFITANIITDNFIIENMRCDSKRKTSTLACFSQRVKLYQNCKL